MWPSRRLQDLFGIEHPIIQAPMAGVTTPALAAAASNAGGLGSLGCGFLDPKAFEAEYDATRALTNHSLHVNFFAHARPEHDPAAAERARALLAPHYERLHLGAVPEPTETIRTFDAAMLEAVEATKPPVVSFHFGLPDAHLLAMVRETGAIILGSATTPAEARDLASRGVDAVIAQGVEAGGHHGFYLTDRSPQMTTIALVPQIVDAVDVPVIAAGGIADGRGVAAALALGADGVQVGTAFLLADEAATPDYHRRRLEVADGSETVLTSVFSGRPARSLCNRLTEELLAHEAELPAYPLMVPMTRPLKPMDDGDFANLWSGQGVGLASAGPTSAIFERLLGETATALARLRV